MSVSKLQTEILKQKIIESFAAVPYPNGVIAPHECDKCLDLRETFVNENWQTIDSKILEENYSKMPLFSSEAFHYFLPAFLIYSLDNFNDNLVCQFTIYTLSSSEKEIKESYDYWQKYWQSRFENFTLEQINLIHEFLNLVEFKKDDGFYLYREYVETGKKMLKEFIEPALKS